MMSWNPSNELTQYIFEGFKAKVILRLFVTPSTMSISTSKSTEPLERNGKYDGNMESFMSK